MWRTATLAAITTDDTRWSMFTAFTSVDHDRRHEMTADYSSSAERLRRSNINGDVFYVSGRSNTAPSDDLAVHTRTTFKYFTYDRDYFRERQKQPSLQDCNLRHSMEWTVSTQCNHSLPLATFAILKYWIFWRHIHYCTALRKIVQFARKLQAV